MKPSKNSTSTQSRTPEQKAKRAAAERERRKRPEVKARQREHWKAWEERNSDYVEPKPSSRTQRTRTLKHKYGITADQWDALFVDQGSVCAICCSDTPGGHGDWHTDHCHNTGRLRGILCHHCNLMLGNARDNSHTLAKAIDYLGKYNG